MNKSKCTQQRYAKGWKSQTSLDKFGFKAGPKTADLPPVEQNQKEDPKLPTVQPNEDSSTPEPVIPSVRPLSVSSDSEESDKEENSPPQEIGTIEIEDDAEYAEEWECELDDAVQGKTEVRDWNVLRQQIKTTLKKTSKQPPLTQINQLMILANFATLRLKGVSRIAASLEIAKQWHEGNGIWFARRVRALARHYQVFEQLPIEKRGGSANARSWLHDESVKRMGHEWLTAQPTRKVTPRTLQHALNTVIFLQLNIIPKTPFCERTARHWLIKLGWRRTVVRKGVYMDGHERADVVKYRQEVFLPAMAQFEARMNRYEGPNLRKIEPNLKPGERRIVGVWHDESCFHANDESRSLW